MIGKEASFGLGKTVAIGDVVYMFQKQNLYAFNLSVETPSLEPVYGLEKATAFIGEDDSVFLAYIGFGRMCLVSARQSGDGLLKITCARFLVGSYVRKNRFHAIAVLDNSEEFVAEGIELHDCLAAAIPGNIHPHFSTSYFFKLISFRYLFVYLLYRFLLYYEGLNWFSEYYKLRVFLVAPAFGYGQI